MISVFLGLKDISHLSDHLCSSSKSQFITVSISAKLGDENIWEVSSAYSI